MARLNVHCDSAAKRAMDTARVAKFFRRAAIQGGGNGVDGVRMSDRRAL